MVAQMSPDRHHLPH
uniref:Uncharacterized protein n=1 Tax=Arundo donax TaxID=35708 RepID=A0A0A8Z007_ARUDO